MREWKGNEAGRVGSGLVREGEKTKGRCRARGRGRESGAETKREGEEAIGI